MKKLKIMAVSVALALGAGSASAAITSTTATSGSSLLLVAWSSTTAYVRNLGITMNALLNNTDPNLATGLNSAWTTAGTVNDKTVAGLGDFAAGANWVASGLVPQGPNTQFMIFAAESSSGGGTSYVRSSDPTVTPISQTNANVSSSANLVLQAINAYTTAGNFSPTFPSASVSCLTGNDCYVQSTASAAYPDGSPFGENSLGAGGNAGAADGLNFWYWKALNALGSQSTTPVQFGEAGNAALNPGRWYLEADGDVRYEVAGGAPIPIPGALWLFGSGLLGLIGISRRRKLAPVQNLATA